MNKIAEFCGPTGEQGRRIEDSPFFNPPKVIVIDGLLAFVPEGLTAEQYQEWYRRMLAANHTVVEMRKELGIGKGEIEADRTPEPAGMGVKVGKWFENVIDRMCKIVCWLWH